MLKVASLKRRSPLIAAPLRTAGQSIDEEIFRIVAEDTSAYVSFGIFIILFACYEWYRWLTNFPPKPFTFSILAITMLAFCAYKTLVAKRKIKNLRLARDGEKAVGEFLDRLRENGYRVFHDIVGGNFNIDHLLIGKTGIYTIETKTLSKPNKGKSEIQYDGNQIKINGHTPERDPIAQAKAQANWIKELVRDLTGKVYKVQPVVLYPGWFIKQPSGAEVWVLNPKALKGFLEKHDAQIDEGSIHPIATHLSRYVRNLKRQ